MTQALLTLITASTISLSLISVSTVAETEASTQKGPTDKKTQPLWELGAGIGALSYPHYPGSDKSNNYVLPAPYGAYRGKYLRADRDGLTGYLFQNPHLRLGLSASFALPADSDDSDIREGMEDLDPMVEIGPRLQLPIWDADQQQLGIDLPIRAVFSVGDATDNYIKHQGWTFEPRVYHRMEWHEWSFTTSVSVLFGDEQYHSYLYGVSQDVAESWRPAYAAKAGYTGARLSIGAKKRFGRLFIGTRLGMGYLEGAANEDSPLFIRNGYPTVALLVAWVFAESKQRVPDD